MWPRIRPASAGLRAMSTGAAGLTRNRRPRPPIRTIEEDEIVRRLAGFPAEERFGIRITSKSARDDVADFLRMPRRELRHLLGAEHRGLHATHVPDECRQHEVGRSADCWSAKRSVVRRHSSMARWPNQTSSAVEPMMPIISRGVGSHSNRRMNRGMRGEPAAMRIEKIEYCDARRQRMRRSFGA